MNLLTYSCIDYNTISIHRQLACVYIKKEGSLSTRKWTRTPTHARRSPRGKRYTQKHQQRARRNFCEIFVKGGIHRETLYVIMKPQRETLFFENSILFQSVLAYDALDNILLKYNKRNKRIAYSCFILEGVQCFGVLSKAVRGCTGFDGDRWCTISEPWSGTR